MAEEGPEPPFPATSGRRRPARATSGVAHIGFHTKATQKKKATLGWKRLVWCVWCVVVVRGVCGARDLENDLSVQASCLRAANWVAEHLGASSRCPRHPFTALMAGGQPWPCTLCTRPYQIKTSTCRNCKISRFLTDCTRGTAQPAHQDVDHHRVRVHLHGEIREIPSYSKQTQVMYQLLNQAQR